MTHHVNPYIHFLENFCSFPPSPALLQATIRDLQTLVTALGPKGEPGSTPPETPPQQKAPPPQAPTQTPASKRTKGERAQLPTLAAAAPASQRKLPPLSGAPKPQAAAATLGLAKSGPGPASESNNPDGAEQYGNSGNGGNGGNKSDGGVNKAGGTTTSGGHGVHASEQGAAAAAGGNPSCGRSNSGVLAGLAGVRAAALSKSLSNKVLPTPAGSARAAAEIGPQGH